MSDVERLSSSHTPLFWLVGIVLGGAVLTHVVGEYRNDGSISLFSVLILLLYLPYFMRTLQSAIVNYKSGQFIVNRFGQVKVYSSRELVGCKKSYLGAGWRYLVLEFNHHGRTGKVYCLLPLSPKHFESHKAVKFAKGIAANNAVST